MLSQFGDIGPRKVEAVQFEFAHVFSDHLVVGRFFVGEALASILAHHYFKQGLSWLKPLPQHKPLIDSFALLGAAGLAV